MPTVTFRLSDSELVQLQRDAAARGVSVSALVREALAFRSASVEERLDDLDRRLGRVEQAAGLD
jgi:predicted DNA binding CopG/RHH family protein